MDSTRFFKEDSKIQSDFFRSNSWGSNLISPSKHHQPEIIGQVCDSFDWFVLETILSAGFTSWYPPLLDYGCSTMFFGKLRKHVPHICVTYTIYSNLTTILVTINGFNAISPPVQFIFWFAHENNNGQMLSWFYFKVLANLEHHATIANFGVIHKTPWCSSWMCIPRIDRCFFW